MENNTDFKLYPLAPQSQATWFGSVENTPAVIGAHSSGHAGRFAAPSGEAVGTTGISVYTGLDPTKVWILLIMMPYGTDTKNVAKVCGGSCYLPGNCQLWKLFCSLTSMGCAI